MVVCPLGTCHCLFQSSDALLKLVYVGLKWFSFVHDWQTVLRGASTQLHQTWRGHREFILTQELCFSVRISCCIFKRGRLKIEWCWKRHQISHFLTTLWKLWINCWSFTYDRTFDGHRLRGCWARWIDKKERKDRKKVQG